ncbi:nuclear transport factor 2 family protein [Leifsonia sp. 2TAF2]|uniref:nuclear transport factor 2 family protein n=1 Tax=Leifsonia sp. 2TAF2 TaxID=3233009 RepID=UPI003F962D94
MTDRRTLLAATAASAGLAVLGTAGVAAHNDPGYGYGPPGGAQSALDQLAIITRINSYGFDYDAGRIVAWATSMFTADVVLNKELAGNPIGQPIVGRDALIAYSTPTAAAWKKAGIQRRHSVASVRVLSLARSSATADCYMVITSTPPTLQTELATSGFYRFNLVKQRGAWLIKSYILGLDGIPGSPPGTVRNPNELYDA